MRGPAHILMPLGWRLALGALLVGLLSSGIGSAAAPSTAAAKPAATATKKPAAAKSAGKLSTPRAPQAVPQEEKPRPELPLDPTLSSDESRPFLTGDEWQDTLQRFEQWLSVQTLYDAEQVKKTRAKFAEVTSKTALADRKQLIDDVDAKLRILYSPAAYDLQDYFAHSLSVASPAYLKKMRQQLPDVVASTPEQLKGRLSLIATKRQSTVDVHQAFERTRQMQMANHELKSEARRFEQPRAPSGYVASSSGGGSGPRKSGYTQSRDYFPNMGSTISYTYIPPMPIFTGNGIGILGGGVGITIQRNR